MSGSSKLRALWGRMRHHHSSSGTPEGGPSDVRVIHCNDRNLNASYGYVPNKTSTVKYTFYSFLPLALFVQYRRAAYWYFTSMAVLSLTPFSPYSPVSVVLPLIFVLALGLGREFWEDLRRSRGDKVVNSRPTQVMTGGKVEGVQWKDLQVGDLVRVADGQFFPADLVVLSSSGVDGICYVETKNLDGETNLKVRQALEVTWDFTEETLESYRANIQCEGPNASLYTFTGRMEFEDGRTFPLGQLQLLLRDSSLQNTGHIWGVVIYTGHDTKVMQNATASPSKRSRIDKSLDNVIYAMFALLLLMSVATGVALAIKTKNDGPDMWYLVPYQSNPYFNPHKAAVAGIVSAVTGLVLYGYLIPIALYVSLEIVRVIQGLFMMQDREMYDPISNKAAKVRSTGLNEELGQVDTILSDKTGTLTANQMDFFRCTIAGVSYGKGTTEVENATRRLGLPLTDDAMSQQVSGEEEPDEAKDNPYYEKGFNFYDSRLLGDSWFQEESRDKLLLFFRILCLCHTTIPEGKVDEPHTLQYRAESPDEAALVVAAKQFGFCFYKKTPSALYVRESRHNGEHEDVVYELLNVLEFSSARKRMSVIVRFPDGKLYLLAKGADSVMSARVDNGNAGFVKPTLRHLQQFAEVGLRTLVLAYRELDQAEYDSWHAKFVEARGIIGRDREQKIEDVEDEIERKLTVIGGTGVEDKLQAGVPDTIDRLAKAGISIWVLTGDKVETAINIGYACSLLRKGMEKVIISLERADAREVEERAERDGLSKDDVNKELTKIVSQQLATASNDIHRMKTGQVGPVDRDPEPENNVIGQSKRSHSPHGSHGSSRSFSEALFRLSRRNSRRETEQEMQEFGTGSSLGRRLENGEASLLNEATGDQNHRLEGFDNQNPTPQEKEDSHAGGSDTDFALVIDGQSLALILEDDKLQNEFIEICKHCVSVLCCRVSPRQKAQVTRLVKKGMGESRLCLAIGDGANDVGMIQEANVGVGITGVEGAQAAMAADYAFGQFRFLERLLFVHGHWSYRRISLMILYFFYKVCLIGWVAFCCNVFAFFSGQPLYNDYYASFYNTVFTAFPICVVGCIDQDVSAAECVKYPQLYRAGHRKELFNRPLVTIWLLNSLYTGLVIFFFPFGLYYLSAFRSGGQTPSIQEFGALLFTCLVLVPNMQLITAISYFTWIHHVLLWGSIILWYIFLLIYGALPVRYATTAYKELIEAVGPSPSYWLLQLLVVIVALLPDFVIRSVKSALFPADYHIVLEMGSKLGRVNSLSQGNSVR